MYVLSYSNHWKDMCRLKIEGLSPKCPLWSSVASSSSSSYYFICYITCHHYLKLMTSLNKVVPTIFNQTTLVKLLTHLEAHESHWIFLSIFPMWNWNCFTAALFPRGYSHGRNLSKVAENHNNPTDVSFSKATTKH